ncbi:MAG: flagellar P-ring protein [Gemmatimonadota bacterium]|nr:MAG: flagellar P-ring protein [Gemmatimonadota bacterium]
MRLSTRLTVLTALAAVVFAAAAGATPVRVKDLVTIEGTDPVEVYGYGLVIGLNGTGDGRSITYTRQSIMNLLERMGLTVSDDRLRAKNVASVMVTGTISPWDGPGSLVDVNVSSIGDATSLAGGFLLLSELRGPDGVLYATSQGSLSVGGFDFSTYSGARVRRNYVTSGRVPEGARIITAPQFDVPAGVVHLFLDEPDFGTSSRIAAALETHWNGPGAVSAVDAGKVAIQLPQLPAPNDFASAMSVLDDVSVEPAVMAKIVINERTGTLVAGGNIRLQPATVSHGNLNVRVEAANAVSQPAPFSDTGVTTAVQNQSVGFDEGRGGVVSLPSTTSADELATALNALGVAPRDLIAIFQALKEAGALPAKMEIL